MTNMNNMTRITLIAPLSGPLVPIERVPDPVFAQKMLGDGLLAALHDHVHELGEEHAVELGVRQDAADGSLGSTGHISLPALPVTRI